MQEVSLQAKRSWLRRRFCFPSVAHDTASFPCRKKTFNPLSWRNHPSKLFPVLHPALKLRALAS
ncbi:unnamed protein product [Chondrus crispus]|uniref:Uncharacterized protein n=1 Tax=Chondrus crispus TaxID=2769 RepID=R7QL02_CHOCR|nr:unnamed protein product [Chondrus crispus]CDF39197.1 unnamed protein product [Chondrus crispus]|eukprot:XP_005719108.1 unnamed protein product [Chondrus crispus]